ncbi:hypothetical protein NM688_g6410 [Phlebia brevispora]|uniref:Uncharacterized protein n=1 Tax=Phlebia brevispora TaxID=194682 RepID=A0ACC1SGB2_9APHY|nr:hypothetical protein NM688_g6410 [Phlebia brevispora]
MSMKEEGPQQHGGLRDSIRRSVSPVRFIIFNLVIGGACLAVLSTSLRSLPKGGSPNVAVPGLDESDPELFWATVPPSPVDNLIWLPCYTNLQCARLTVPLDYADPDGPSATIAMAKVPSNYKKSDPRYRGPILMNPGGPGGSGVDLILLAKDIIQPVVGDEYDIIGFDPRGVGRTMPSILVFSDEAENTRWNLQRDSLPLLNSTTDALSKTYANAVVYGKLAEARTMHASPYVSTALVCRDMLNIVRAHGQEKLQYWGLSYGTVLGATFAAMFPDNVGRMVIDGVEDAENYYATLWSNNLVDTEETLDWFFEECIEAGPELCALYDSSAAKIKERVMRLLASIQKEPIPVVASTTLSSPTEYGIVDYALALRVLFVFLYFPYHTFAQTAPATDLAFALASAEKGDGVPLWNLQAAYIVQFKCSCSPAPPLPQPIATTAIMCSDGDPVEESIEEMQTLLDKIARDSMFAPLWPLHVVCAGWKIRPVERYNGPFVGNTSFPLLIIGNTADPVTPLINAHNLAKGFPGSVVLTQHSAGHCSVSATSACTILAIREYFRDGKVPQPGTRCEIESRMFTKTDFAYDNETWFWDLPEDEREAVKAWKKLTNTITPHHYGMLSAM